MVFSAAPAAAKCVSTTSLCVCIGANRVVDGVVSSTSDGTTVISVQATHGEVPDGGSPASISTPAFTGDAVGRRTLLLQESDALMRRIVADANGDISCRSGGAPVMVSADDAIVMALSPTCDDDLRARGVTNLPCNDTGPFVGCGCSAPAGSGTLAFASLALAFCLAHQRRQRGRAHHGHR
ncbi:MAG: hypothetical protein ACYC8T_33670 [Myxococcaceae bacterium]